MIIGREHCEYLEDTGGEWFIKTYANLINLTHDNLVNRGGEQNLQRLKIFPDESFFKAQKKWTFLFKLALQKSYNTPENKNKGIFTLF